MGAQTMTINALQFLASVLAASAWAAYGVGIAAAAEPRSWSDATGLFTMEAELVAFNERSVVLQRADHDLVAIPIEQLSQQDREYLASQEGANLARQELDAQQTWKLRNGATLVGRLVDYARRDLTIQQRRRRVYVNDRRLENLPEFYQQLVPAIVAHYENLSRADRRGLNNWLSQQGGRPQTFQVDGVVLEDESGDEYAVPFFLFSDEDLAVLKPGWEESLAAQQANEFTAQEDHAFWLQSLAAARNRDPQVTHEIAMMQLKLQAVEAGLTSLWEVTLFPVAGNGSPPQWVVVAGRNSLQATDAALRQNPGFVAGPVRRVSRR
jgi:hypothetical protein